MLKEIIVVDDFSVDGSWEILTDFAKKYPDLLRVVRNKQKGGNHARNYGFLLSSGQYIQWLDADDQIAPGKLSAQVEFLQRNPQVAIAYSDWEQHFYDNLKLTRKETKSNANREDMTLELLNDNWSPPNVYLIRRATAENLQKNNAWNPLTKVCQDREYYTIAAALGASFGYVPGAFAIYNRWSRSSVSVSNLSLRFESIEAILNRAEDLLEIQNWPTREARMKYKRAIVTQKVMMAALGHAVVLKQELKLSDIDWRMFKGFRTRLKMLLFVLKKSSWHWKPSISTPTRHG